MYPGGIIFCMYRGYMYAQMTFSDNCMIYLETWHFYLFKWWYMINLDIKSVWIDIPAQDVCCHYIYYLYLYLFVFYFLIEKKLVWCFNPQIHKWGYVHFFTSKDSKSIVKKHHKNIINRDITTKYYLYLLYFTLVS